MNIDDGPGVLDALRIPAAGRVYDLSSGWWRHMPQFSDAPRFEVLTYSSPRGRRLERRPPFDDESANTAEWGFVSELVSLSLHTGTHVDALSHVTAGPDNSWHGGVSADDNVGDNGPLRDDASALPPILCRGVLLDVPRLLGFEHLPPGFAIQEEHVRGAAQAQRVTLRRGDTVLVRTGQMRFWPDEAAMAERAGGSGVDVGAARWIADQGAAFVGADTLAFEVRPSRVAGNGLPVHTLLLRERGVPILEFVHLEQIAAQRVHEFLFVALPLTIRGGTGSPVRPIAIA